MIEILWSNLSKYIKQIKLEKINCKLHNVKKQI